MPTSASNSGRGQKISLPTCLPSNRRSWRHEEAHHRLKHNSRVIYCSIPGFASDDPRAAIPAYEGIVGAASATYRPSSSTGDRPLYTAIPIASTYGAFQSVVAIAMALNARERDGLGQRIDVPLFDSMFQSIGRFGVRVHNAAPSLPTLQELWGGIFQGKDGQWVRFGGPGNQNFRSF